jgi:hypothetical protein
LPYSIFTFSRESCLAVQSQIANDFIAQIANRSLTPMLVNFSIDASLCQPRQVSVCGSFVSEAEARQLEPWAGLQAPFWLHSLTGDCDAVTAGYNFRLQSDSNWCLDVDVGSSCRPDDVTFPHCK